MTAPLFGNHEPLGSFVEGIGRNLFIYKGYDVFEGVLACFLSLNVRREENNFVYAPQLPLHIKTLMEQSAVRFTTSLYGDGRYNIFNNDFNEDACTELDSDRLLFVGNDRNPDGEIGIAFSRELPIDTSFMDHVSAKLAICAPYNPGMLLAGRYRALITTDWRWHALAGMVNVPSVLLSGPRHPRWISKLGGHVIDGLVDRRSSLKACQCARTSLCHAQSVEAKPCMTTAPWGNLKTHVVELLSQ